MEKSEQSKKIIKYCSVPGCKTPKNIKIMFHKPPSDKILFKKWSIALKVKKLTPYMLVCRQHFKPSDYFNSGKIFYKSIIFLKDVFYIPLTRVEKK